MPSTMGHLSTRNIGARGWWMKWVVISGLNDGVAQTISCDIMGHRKNSGMMDMYIYIVIYIHMCDLSRHGAYPKRAALCPRIDNDEALYLENYNFETNPYGSCHVRYYHYLIWGETMGNYRFSNNNGGFKCDGSLYRSPIFKWQQPCRLSAIMNLVTIVCTYLPPVSLVIFGLVFSRSDVWEILCKSWWILSI